MAVIEVVGGDSKDKLLAQLSDIGRVSDRPGFNITLRLLPGFDKSKRYKLSLRVYGIVADNGSGDEWMFYARLTRNALNNDPELIDYFNVRDWDRKTNAGEICVRYNTKTRKGKAWDGLRSGAYVSKHT